MMAAKIAHELAVSSDTKVLLIVNNKIYKMLYSICGDSCKYVSFDFNERKFESVLGFLNPFLYLTLLKLFRVCSVCSSLTLVNGGITANHSSTLAILLICKFRNIPSYLYYPMIHSPTELGLTNFRKISYNRAIKRIVKIRPNFITIDAIWAKRLNVMYGCEDKISIIHNYIPYINDINNNQMIPINKTKIQLGFVGRLDCYQKGLDLLSSILFNLASKINTPIEFHIVGDGPYRDEFLNIINNISSPCIDFKYHGWVSDASSVIRCIDLLLLPSRLEGVPTVMLEAIISNTYVIAFDIDGISKVLGSDFLVKPFDIDAFVNKIIYVITNNINNSYNVEYVNLLMNKERFSHEVKFVYC